MGTMNKSFRELLAKLGGELPDKHESSYKLISKIATAHEAGGGGGEDNTFIVTYTARSNDLSITADEVTCDKTYAEITSALEAGKIIVPVIKAYTPASATNPSITCFGVFYKFGDYVEALFNPCITGNGLWVVTVAADSTNTITVRSTGIAFE